jgi:hypothetical protein
MSYLERIAVLKHPRSPRILDTGPDGDPNPSMVLADLVDVKAEASAIRRAPVSPLKPLFAPVSDATLASLEKTAPDFTVTFTEDKQGFYINGKRYEDPLGVLQAHHRHWDWCTARDERSEARSRALENRITGTSNTPGDQAVGRESRQN